MANGTVLNPGSGGNTAYDIDTGGGVHVAVVSINTGITGSSVGTQVSATNPLPVQAGDGTNQILSGSAANLSAETSIHAQLSVPPGEWAVNNQATAGTPTITKAAGATGVRHVCTSVSLSVSCGATAQTPVIVNLRDGGTGAGTILRTWALSAPVDGTAGFSERFNIVGSAATAMTIEFAGTTVTAAIGSVNMSGYDCV